MRVMIVGPYPIDSTPVGGVESAVDGLVRGLSEQREVEEIHVVDFRPGARSVIERPLNTVLVHRLPAQRRLRLLNDASSDLRRLRELVREVRPDVVHGQGVGLHGLHAVSLGLPSVVTVHGIISKEAQDVARGVADRLRVVALNRIVNRIVRRSDCMISISEYDRRAMPQLRGAKRNLVIPNAIPFCASDSRHEGPPQILCAGVLIPRKNVTGVVRAFGKVLSAFPDARLQLAGAAIDAEYAAEIRRAEAECCAGAVDWLGQLSRDEVNAALTRSVCVVLFSHQETLPVIIGEAMTCGKAVVASAVGGVQEMVIDGVTGLIVTDGDEDALADAMITLLSSSSLRASMGAAAHERAERLYGMATVAESTMVLYREVIGAR